MLVYLILAIVTGFSPLGTAARTVGIAQTCSEHRVALPTGEGPSHSLLYFAETEIEADTETSVADRPTTVSTIQQAPPFFESLLAAYYSARSVVSTLGPPVPQVTPTPIIVLHQVFRI